MSYTMTLFLPMTARKFDIKQNAGAVEGVLLIVLEYDLLQNKCSV